MDIREPAVAGQFYPESAESCRAEVRSYLSAAESLAQQNQVTKSIDRPNLVVQKPAECADSSPCVEDIAGGIVPHAGWICSGQVAAEVFWQLLQHRPIDTVVIFGAAHRLISKQAALSQQIWATPLGEMAIDDELAQATLSLVPNDVCDQSDAHEQEHSIEVQLPFIQYLLPTARLLPILVPHVAPAVAIGRTVAMQAERLGRQVVFVGSTDLTHYGPRYRFTPKGTGPTGLTWAKQHSDQRFIDLACNMQADAMVSEASQHHNACGAAAVAATIAACQHRGATRGILLRHTTSAEVLLDRFGPTDDAVGYAGILFAKSKE